MTTRIVRFNGTKIRVPAGLFLMTPGGGPICETREPDWPDGSGGSALCELPVHKTGPDGQAHIATDAGWPTGNIITLWQEADALPNSDDED